MRVAAMRREIAASGGIVPGATSPEDAAAFVLASAAKARGQVAPAAAARAGAKPNLTTPEAAADFVIASAAKARGQRHDMNTAEGVAASTLAAALRAGVIK